MCVLFITHKGFFIVWLYVTHAVCKYIYINASLFAYGAFPLVPLKAALKGYLEH